MGETKQIDIKNRSYYLYRNLSDLKNFDAEFIKIDKKSDKNIDIYYIGYRPFIKIGDYWSNFTVNPFFLDIAYASEHIECNSIECNYIECNSIEEKNGNKYLVLDDIDENKEVLKNMKKFGRVLKKKLKLLMVAKKLNMGKIFKKLGLSLMMICH